MAYKKIEFCPFGESYFREIAERNSTLESSKILKTSPENVSKWMRDFNIQKKIGNVKNLELSPLQKDLIYGSMLGDGSLSKTKNTVYYTESHSENQLPYLEWKHKILSDIVTSPIRIAKNKNCGFKNNIYVFSSRTNIYLDEIYDNFYRDSRVKTLPQDLEDRITDFILAVLYMDDGYLDRKQNSLCIYSSGFSKSENEILHEILLKKFNIKTTVRRKWDSKYKKEYYYLYILKESFNLFIEVVKPHIHTCIYYKLPY